MMRAYTAAGILLVIGLVLMWAGFAGRMGGLFAALFAPQGLRVTDATDAMAGG